ncbi:MAG: hypothetical protein HKP40_02405 [Litoreibacter sp.]|nr:hypothetical protein [Litoreibacter sp.]
MADENQKFVRKTLRHFAVMRNLGPGASLSDTPFPDDWFDLPEDVLADFGAMVYLASLTKLHQKHILKQAMGVFEPPLRLGQYRIFSLERISACLHHLGGSECGK